MSLAELVAALPDAIRPLRRVEYERLVDDGAFDEEQLELLDGVLVEMSPQGAAHSDVVTVLGNLLRAALGSRYLVREEKPLSASDVSVPEPDLVVVPARSYRGGHPTTALLAVEVARSSQPVDLGRKPRIYAGAGIAEYWVIDLAAEVVVVHRRPGPEGYAEVVRVEGGELRAAVLPEVVVDLAELFAD